MRENRLRTLTEASRAAMPARERNWEVVSRWINPRACLAPLLVGTLVLSAPSGAAAGDNYVKSMDLDLTSGEVRILSSDDETYDTIQDGEVGFTARFGIDLRRPGAFDGIAIHLGECTGHGGECYTKPLIFSTTAAGRDFFTERTFTESSGGIRRKSRPWHACGVQVFGDDLPVPQAERMLAGSRLTRSRRRWLTVDHEWARSKTDFTHAQSEGEHPCCGYARRC